MPRRIAPKPDVMLSDALSLLQTQLRKLKRAQRSKEGLTGDQVSETIRITNTLREIEAARHRPWSPDRLGKLTDRELEEEIARAKAGEN